MSCSYSVILMSVSRVKYSTPRYTLSRRHTKLEPGTRPPEYIARFLKTRNKSRVATATALISYFRYFLSVANSIYWPWGTEVHTRLYLVFSVDVRPWKSGATHELSFKQRDVIVRPELLCGTITRNHSKSLVRLPNLNNKRPRIRCYQEQIELGRARLRVWGNKWSQSACERKQESLINSIYL